MGDLHLRRGFSLHMVFPGVFFRDICLPPPDHGPPSDGVAGRGHAIGLQEINLQGVIRQGRGNAAKKRLRFHALVKLVFDYQRVTDSPVVASRRILVLTATTRNREVFGAPDARSHEITWGAAVILVEPRRALSYSSPQARREITAHSIFGVERNRTGDIRRGAQVIVL